MSDEHHPDCMRDLPPEASLGIWDCHPDCPIRSGESSMHESKCVERRVFVCDGCSAWTDREVTKAELLGEWFWTEGEVEPLNGPLPPIFCTECQ